MSILNHRAIHIILVLFLCTAITSAKAQTVGVVLSGGGASGMAHIGMLRALEENDIPIDYIAGTSMGAVIGGLYASGMTIDEMEAYFTSEEFTEAIRGSIDEQYIYYFKQKSLDASMISLKIDPDTLFLRTIPSFVISPVAMDMKMLETVSSAIALAGYDFDELIFVITESEIHLLKPYTHVQKIKRIFIKNPSNVRRTLKRLDADKNLMNKVYVL